MAQKLPAPEAEERAMSSTEAMVTTLLQDYDRLNSRMTTMAQRMAKMSKFHKMDDILHTADESSNISTILRAVADNTRNVNSLVGEMREREDPEVMTSNEFFRRGKITRKNEVESNMRDIQKLAQSRQSITPECPCGEHKGIRFVEQIEDNEFVVLDEMCPMVWWRRMSRAALKNGRLSEFNASTPLNEYLIPYRK